MSNTHRSSKKYHKSKKSSKISKHHNKSLKSLHGALRSLLQQSNQEHKPKTNKLSPKPQKQTKQNKTDSNIIYIRSKENALIPKLTDDEVMERHKRADESMKTVWSNIIAKYEAIDDSKGDMLDLASGEIIEDNGHLRGLSEPLSNSTYNTKYKSTLTDIIPTTDGVEKMGTSDEDGNRSAEGHHESTIWDETDSERDSEAGMSDSNEDDIIESEEESLSD